jgi:hypothetical protein
MHTNNDMTEKGIPLIRSPDGEEIPKSDRRVAFFREFVT